VRHIPSLDGLRAISILLVIAAHAGVLGTQSDVLGSLGVRVFFVISGFLITSILLKEIVATGSVNLRRFYVRRTLRIFPAFYTFLAVLALLHVTGVIDLNPFDLTRAGLYVTNYFPWDSQSVFVRHTWSLSNEEQFYLLWPACLAFAGAKRSARIAFAVILLVPCVRMAIVLANGSPVATIDRRFDCVADALATGCLLACVLAYLAANRRYLRFLSSPAFALAPILVIGAALTNLHPHVYFFVSQTVMNIGIAVCIDRCIRHPHDIAGKLLNSPPLRWIGSMSYSLYLWQQIFVSEGPEWWRAFPLNLALALAAAAASYYLIEGPFQRLKNHIRIAA
jgi:peptidoglycan/LPS O-acetylase OafA/YrhL